MPISYCFLNCVTRKPVPLDTIKMELREQLDMKHDPDMYFDIAFMTLTMIGDYAVLHGSFDEARFKTAVDTCGGKLKMVARHFIYGKYLYESFRTTHS